MEFKQATIKEIEESLSKCTVAIVTNFQGLSVSDMTQLRNKLRDASVEYRVVKNTLARFASERVGKDELKQLLQGPSAIAFGYEDVSSPAKALNEFIQATKLPLSIKGGILGERFLAPADVTYIANIPPREVLVSRLMAQMQMPVVGLVGVLSGVLRGLVQVLEARRQQLEGE